MKKQKSSRCSIKLSAISLAILSSVAHADTPFDIRVSYYDTTENATTRRAAIEANINYFAEALYEATNGAHRLRNVTVFTNGAFKDDTDVLWVNSCWPNAHTNSRGVPGLRIEHCDIFPNGGNPLNLLDNTASGGSVLMHEWGHFTYALLDEYQNSDQQCDPNQPSSPCKDDVGVPNSLMHNQWQAANSSGWLSENLAWLNFSTKDNFNTATAQARVYKSSAWETLAREKDPDDVMQLINGRARTFYPDLVAAAPAAGTTPSIEINADANRNQARSLLNIIWKTDATANGIGPKAIAGKKRLPIAKQLVIENSNNISSNMLEEIKAAVGSVIEQSNEGDTLGLISFDSSPTILVAPTQITDEASKTKLLNALNGIRITTQPAALGEALKTAASSLKSSNITNSTVSSVYLFADGYSAMGVTQPLSQIDSYQKEGITLFSFGLNKDLALVTLLKNLAEKTRGDYYLVDKPDVLAKAIQQTEERITPQVDVQIIADNSSMTNNQEVPFYVDNNTDAIETVISYEGKASAYNFVITDAQGKVTPFDQSRCVSEESADAGNASNYCTLNIADATEGTWKLKMTTNTTSPVEVFYSVSADPKDDNSAISASIYASNPIADIGSNVNVIASVGREFPITNLTVTGKLEKPDASTVALKWHDDGVKPDVEANDGKYTATFLADTEGSFFASVNFDNLANQGVFTNSGTTYAAINPNAGPGLQKEAVNFKFTRATSTDVIATKVVTGTKGLTDYDRVMNWGEAVVAPGLLPVKGKQLMDISSYKVRYYPQTDTYLGYNTTDGNLYIKLGSQEVSLLGPLSNYLTSAKNDGF